MLLVPHLNYLSHYPGLQKFIQPPQKLQTMDNIPSNNIPHKFIVGFRNRLNTNYQWITIKEDSRCGLVFCYELHANICSHIQHLYQLEQYEKLSAEQKSQMGVFQKKPQTEMHKKFREFLDAHKIKVQYHYCNAVLLADHAEVCILNGPISEQKLSMIKKSVGELDQDIFQNVIVNSFDSFEQLSQSGCLEICKQQFQRKLTKEEAESIELSMKNFDGQYLMRIPKYDPKTGDCGELGDIDLKFLLTKQ